MRLQHSLVVPLLYLEVLLHDRILHSMIVVLPAAQKIEIEKDATQVIQITVYPDHLVMNFLISNRKKRRK